MRVSKIAASAVAACALAGAFAGAQAATVLSEGFTDITTLATSVWVATNNSAPVGDGWFQGNSGIFAAQAGAASSYVGVNFNATTAASGVIDTWLISPVLTLGAGASVSFYTRASDVGFLDRLDVLFNSGSSSATGSFTTVLGTVGSASTATYPTSSWALVTYALPTAATGRIAFHYSVADAMNASYIGIDSVTVTAVPEPATVALFGLGMAVVGTAAARRRAQRSA